ncbi:class I histocompatibility antigen, F10 alpha chain-like [Alligator mississippiensis]|uniref:class I histocompatibility antigen, F10 alpha chain-like n=1 Tax=Alligator mississippiensis TaxID=8496 RepID=UPI002877A328|nr:class I histocompatibility antigen, F10 alpha chain-like [Alligator mississippiensis]
MDDQQILHYDSETRREEPRGDCVQGAVDPDFWDGETRSLRGWQWGFEANLVTLWQRYNQTSSDCGQTGMDRTMEDPGPEGVSHSPFMYGCELGEDGSAGGYMQFSYDGGDFLSCALRTRTWVAVVPQAQITQRNWNEDKALLTARAYLEEPCIEWLQKYLQHGKAALQSKPPMAQVSDKPSSRDGLTTLSCQVHCFYPKYVAVIWLKNGEAQPQETSCSGVVPSTDGTYHTWVTIEINSSSNHNYTCNVEHMSPDADLQVAWDKSRKGE